MPVLYLTETDVRELLDMEICIDVVEEAFRQLAYAGWKAYTSTSHGAKFHVGLYSINSGDLVALIEANYLGQLRTGAASAVATECMARPDAKVVGLFGS